MAKLRRRISVTRRIRTTRGPAFELLRSELSSSAAPEVFGDCLQNHHPTLHRAALLARSSLFVQFAATQRLRSLARPDACGPLRPKCQEQSAAAQLLNPAPYLHCSDSIGG